jgi:hypothetical protein
MSLGSYFGSTKIIQGAAGLGQDGPLMAYADGVVGGSAESADMPGPLFAYSDGSLGNDGMGPLQAYSDGVVGGSSANPDMPGPLFAYHDGSLGGDAGDDPGGTPISVFQDGIFERAERNANFGPLQSFHDGSLGAVASTGPVLDLGDAGVLAEVKALIAYSSGGYALSSEAQKVYTPDWYTSGIWEPSASALWQFVVSSVPAFSGKTVSGSAAAQTFPNGLGIAYLYGLMAAPTANAMGPDGAKKMFPMIAAWVGAKGTDVLPPYLSLADKTRGERGSADEAGMSTGKMAMWGLGAAALLGVALVFGKKSYRKNSHQDDLRTDMFRELPARTRASDGRTREGKARRQRMYATGLVHKKKKPKRR